MVRVVPTQGVREYLSPSEVGDGIAAGEAPTPPETCEMPIQIVQEPTRRPIQYKTPQKPAKVKPVSVGRKMT